MGRRDKNKGVKKKYKSVERFAVGGGLEIRLERAGFNTGET